MATAIFELKDEDTFLPAWARGKGLQVSKIRCHCADGHREEHVPDADRRITVTEDRSIRHLKADTRFVLISETP